VAVSLRKATYSYSNIVERKAFTVSVPSVEQIGLADYCGLVSGRTVDKFSVCKLTPVHSELVDAPYPLELPMVLECRVLQVLEIGLHTQFVGEILDVKADESVLGPDGNPMIEKVQPLIFAPRERTYHGICGLQGKAFEVGRGLMKK
jgi:flavin reductase (DIM6/NTAB) family NADH-FMN oxidoreductase RutF